jgi:hypothetical protein
MIEMHDNNAELHELRTLLTAAVLEDATVEQWDRLNQWLLSDAEARRIASRFLEEESMLRRQFEMFDRVVGFHTPPETDCCDLSGDADLEPESRETQTFPESSIASSRVRRAIAVLIALAACILLAFGALEVWDNHGDQFQLADRRELKPLATQVGLMYQDQFSDPGTGLADDLSLSSPIRVGDLITTDSGLAKLQFTCGAEVLLKGPAVLKVLSPMRASLRRGTLTARVEESAHGFRIDTPNSKVIDLGTEFGLTVDENGATDMVVFSGKVALEYSDTKPDDSLTPALSIPPSNVKLLGGGRLLTDGEAMRITETGEVKRLMTVRNSDYPLPSDQHRQPANWTPIIGSVSDNLREGDTTMCYRIVHHGFDEDARAFVDRPYEWNGLNAEYGLPKFLRGADYVMPFCDDKLSSTLEVRVAITRPARLFVLIDNRVELPQWLTERFRDSGFDIGIDESARAASWLSLGRGAGVSIDESFSVWYMDVELPSTVLLGSMKSPTNISLMYCVAAIPLELASTTAAEPIRHHRPRLGRGFTTPDLLPTPQAEVRTERVNEFSQLTIARPTADDLASGKNGVKFRIESNGEKYLPHARVVVDRGMLPLLNNGQVAQNNDDLNQNVWYDGQGRFSVDMLKPVEIAEINTFSWHWLERAPQFFTVWGSDAEQMPDTSFVEAEQANGWELIGYVNTFPLGHGGVHASSLRGGDGSIGRYRHLLWITENTTRGTFFTEIDVHAANE